ncbi:MAG: hypothetical protein K6E81_01350 [Lachnospiraceae bacterium]|nr:hypothetical protein [Lachnospiraceae bacterium]
MITRKIFAAKKYMALFLAGALLLAGCAEQGPREEPPSPDPSYTLNDPQEGTDTGAGEAGNAEGSGSESEAGNADASGSGSEAGNGDAAPAVIGPDIVKQFLRGERTLKVKDSYLSDTMMINGENLKAGASYDFDGLADAVMVDAYEGGSLNFDIDRRQYRTLDLSYAPGEWYLLCLFFSNPKVSYDESQAYFVLQELDGELYLAHANESYYRVYSYLCENGLSVNTGSGGAGYFGYSYYVCDSNGDYREYYHGADTWYGWSFYEEGDDHPPINALVEDFAAAQEAAGKADTLDNFYMTQYCIDGQYYYFMQLDHGDEGILQEFADFAQAEGVRISTMDEVNAALEKRSKALGLPSDYAGKDSPEIDYEGTWLYADENPQPKNADLAMLEGNWEMISYEIGGSFTSTEGQTDPYALLTFRKKGWGNYTADAFWLRGGQVGRHFEGADLVRKDENDYAEDYRWSVEADVKIEGDPSADCHIYPVQDDILRMDLGYTDRNGKAGTITYHFQKELLGHPYLATDGLSAYLQQELSMAPANTNMMIGLKELYPGNPGTDNIPVICLAGATEDDGFPLCFLSPADLKLQFYWDEIYMDEMDLAAGETGILMIPVPEYGEYFRIQFSIDGGNQYYYWDATKESIGYGTSEYSPLPKPQWLYFTL